jgi:hypothetical protein
MGDAMTLDVSPSSCPHPDQHLKLAVRNPGTVWQQPQAAVFCDQCRGAWTAYTLPESLLDRCLQLFEGMKR